MLKITPFYAFLIPHLLLIGLLPFFIPVILWKNGFNIADISLLISISAASFCITLYGLNRLYQKGHWLLITTLSLTLELGLISTLPFQSSTLFFTLLAVLLGGYNCLFWMTKRVLFFDALIIRQTGRQFGNFQITAFIVLKISLFISGFLMEYASLWHVYGLSTLIVALTGLYFFKNTQQFQASLYTKQLNTVGIKHIMRFKDGFRSKFIFILDGPFLFLESFFWLISLFLIAEQSFSMLGTLVVIMAASFALLFMFIKSIIDQIPTQTIYLAASIGYCLSWYLRSIIDLKMTNDVLLTLLILISFLTAFFRLTFNKRFFNIAKTSTQYHYLFLKSYYSQLSTAVVFLVIALLAYQENKTVDFLKNCYQYAALVALLYGLYRPIHATSPNYSH